MNNLCADIGYSSVNHFGEELCGDHVDIVEQSDNSTVVVLADGLGSGVKASILSTLTSKIISTMLSQGLSIEQCVSTIAAALPVCSLRGVAYSTFTIIHIVENSEAQIIQYDNPNVIMYRNGEICDYEKTTLNIGGKDVLKSKIRLCDNDVFVAMSDGCPHAGVGVSYNFGWTSSDIEKFVKPLLSVGYTAKTLSSLLIDKVNSLYDSKPGDDATACIIHIRKREPVNLLFGPPSDRDDCTRMMSLFFSKEGKHIICGGTTSSIAAKYLGKPLRTSLHFESADVPPIAELEGADLVTEGVITVSKVLDFAKDYVEENKLQESWCSRKDGASLICRMLFQQATDINFFVGRAINPAHQNPDLPINFSIKMNLVKELSQCLKKMGKRIKVSYF